MIKFIPATMEHAEVVLANLREQEIKTIAKLGVDPRIEIERVIGQAFVCLVNGTPVALFGTVQETMMGNCRLWMLTTPGVERHQISLLRWSRRYVELMAHMRHNVIGMVDSENQISRRWLEWLGFVPLNSNGDFTTMRYSNGH